MSGEPKKGLTSKVKEWWSQDDNLDRSLFRYRKLWVSITVSTCLVSLVPLIVMAIINYYQYEKAFREEVKHPIRLLASNARRSLEFFLHERLSVLRYIVEDTPGPELHDQKRLTRVFNRLREVQTGFVDIGVIDGDGIQRHYVGPYGLRQKSYKGQPWFQTAMSRGKAVSDVFMGYRNFPHFVIAVRRLDEEGQAYILRATLNADILANMREPGEARAARDTLIVNHQGVLQTPSKRNGRVLEKLTLPLPPPADTAKVLERSDRGMMRVVGYAYVPDSPFIFLAIEERSSLLSTWFSLRNTLLLFLGGSMAVILFVILAGSKYTVNRIREADDKRLALLHKVEYTSKMASIGRLAAGVAHEINNPLAIINEKAGLLKDILAMTKDKSGFPKREKFVRNIDQIIDSVGRCARITRRLLRFAKHMDIRREPIDLAKLMREVLGFLEKEAHHRGLAISIESQDDVPVVESDRGRLQQVFLNIVNNAFSAVEDDGRIHILVAREGDNHVSVTIRDNGEGIPEEHMAHIFEPFFTTKEKHGTGLGLSITYGIVEKLGGKITVDSQLGEWTKFSVILPLKPENADGKSTSAAG